VLEQWLMADETPRQITSRDAASVGEIVEFVKTYAKQETLGPLKGAGRWVAVGAAAAIALGLGLALLLLGLLRFLQTEWGWVQTQGKSWIPYVIVLLVCAVLLALTLTRINKTFLSKEAKR
jgi:uncharacterized membrane protein YidH (DUF202 family)